MVLAAVCLGVRGLCGVVCIVPAVCILQKTRWLCARQQCRGNHLEPWTHPQESPAAVDAAGCAPCHSDVLAGTDVGDDESFSYLCTASDSISNHCKFCTGTTVQAGPLGEPQLARI